MPDKEKATVNDLEIMFPGEDIDIKGFIITMKPLPLEHLPKVMKQFSSIMGMLLKKKGIADTPDEINTQIAIDAIVEAIVLLPYCMFRKNGSNELVSLPMKDVPVQAVTKLMKVFLKQNIPEDMLGEWEALIGGDLKKPVAND